MCRILVWFCIVFFFFKQKTAYEIKECDWSSDVCSSDLIGGVPAMDSGRSPTKRSHICTPVFYFIRAINDCVNSDAPNKYDREHKDNDRARNSDNVRRKLRRDALL